MILVQNAQAIALGRIESLAGGLAFVAASALVLTLVLGLY